MSDRLDTLRTETTRWDRRGGAGVMYEEEPWEAGSWAEAEERRWNEGDWDDPSIGSLLTGEAPPLPPFGEGGRG